jgi:hypothetical protein
MNDIQVGAQLAPSLPAPISLIRQMWPLAGLALVVIVITAWTGFVGLSIFLTIL